MVVRLGASAPSPSLETRKSIGPNFDSAGLIGRSTRTGHRSAFADLNVQLHRTAGIDQTAIQATGRSTKTWLCGQGDWDLAIRAVIAVIEVT